MYAQDIIHIFVKIAIFIENLKITGFGQCFSERNILIKVSHTKLSVYNKKLKKWLN